jgi:hypothetical protein
VTTKVGVDDLIAAGFDRHVLESLDREEYVDMFQAPRPPLAFAQDFRDGRLSFGWTRRETRTDAKGKPQRMKMLYLVTSVGDLYQGRADQAGTVTLNCLRSSSAETSGKTIAVIDRSAELPGDATWAKRYLDGEREYTCALFRSLISLLQRRIVFVDELQAPAVALWIMATYCYRVFDGFPYLWIRSPRQRCGKTRLLDTLSVLGFNASRRYARPTEAVLIRAPSRSGGVQIIDEADRLRKEDTVAALVEVLNHGYLRDGVAPRVNRDTGEVEEFDVYCPKAIAGLKAMADTLEDRSIQIVLQRKRPGEGGRFRYSDLEHAAAPLRDRLKIWALAQAPALAALADSQELVLLTRDLADDRLADLVEPLLAVALLADGEEDEGIAKGFLQFCSKQANRRSAGEGDSDTATLIRGLRRVLGIDAEVRVRPTDLLRQLTAEESLGWIRSTKSLAGLLTPLELATKTVRFSDGTRGRAYVLEAERLDDLLARYAPDDPPGEEE